MTTKLYTVRDRQDPDRFLRRGNGDVFFTALKGCRAAITWYRGKARHHGSRRKEPTDWVIYEHEVDDGVPTMEATGEASQEAMAEGGEGEASHRE